MVGAARVAPGLENPGHQPRPSPAAARYRGHSAGVHGLGPWAGCAPRFCPRWLAPLTALGEGRGWWRRVSRPRTDPQRPCRAGVCVMAVRDSWPCTRRRVAPPPAAASRTGRRWRPARPGGCTRGPADPAAAAPAVAECPPETDQGDVQEPAPERGEEDEPAVRHPLDADRHGDQTAQRGAAPAEADDHRVVPIELDVRDRGWPSRWSATARGARPTPGPAPARAQKAPARRPPNRPWPARKPAKGKINSEGIGGTRCSSATSRAIPGYPSDAMRSLIRPGGPSSGWGIARLLPLPCRPGPRYPRGIARRRPPPPGRPIRTPFSAAGGSIRYPVNARTAPHGG